MGKKLPIGGEIDQIATYDLKPSIKSIFPPIQNPEILFLLGSRDFSLFILEITGKSASFMILAKHGMR